MQIAISAYQQQHGKTFSLTPMVPGLFDWSVSSGDLGKARQRLIERVRKEVAGLELRRLTRLLVPPGRRLLRERIEFVVRSEGDKAHVTGWFPLVLEERSSGGDRVLRIAYHPLQPGSWFEPSESEPLAVALARHYSRTLDADAEIDAFRSSGREKLVTLRFQVEAPSLRERLKSRRQDDERTLSGRSGDLAALLRVAVNQTARAAEGTLPTGLPRERERERLRQLLCGRDKSPVLVVGPPGSGRSTLIAQAVHDLLEADDFPAHGNMDRVHNVISLAGRQIIAGMSYAGQWEARCVELLARVKKRRLLLWVDDVPAFSSIGKSTASDRTLADFFRGPLARRELVIIAECTPAQLSLLQHEAPAFAAAFSVVHLAPATRDETLAMLLFESRRLEQELDVAIEPRALLALIEQSTALAAGLALPGRALAPLAAIARSSLREGMEPGEIVGIGVEQVLQFFSAQTGLLEILLSGAEVLERTQLRREFAQQIMGQTLAVEAACDLILSLRAKLCARGRPYGVFLFTGPTGTGKTELAKCLAAYLYGASERLLRFDMGELSGPDAVARLIGDQYEPDGLLTSRVRAQPFTVLLFDEIEKAHPSVLNLMLQIFEDARLSDARGNVTDFSHVAIVLTSNLGTARAAVRGFARDGAAQAAEIAQGVREFFPPELFNRIDRVVPFGALDPAAAHDIVKKELAALVARPGLSERNTFVRFTDAVVARIVQNGFDADYGARSLKRYIDREIAGALTQALVADVPAEMRLLWMFSDQQLGVGIHVEALREASPFSESGRTLPLLEASYESLRSRIPAAIEELERLERDGRLNALGEHLALGLSRYRLGELGRASDVYNLDSVRAHAHALIQRMEARLRADRELEARLRQRKLSLGESLDESDFATLGAAHERPFEPRSGRPATDRFAAGADRAQELLRDLAEVTLLERLLQRAHVPDRHVAIVEVLKLSLHNERRRFSKGNPGLAEWLAEMYASARGELDCAAVLDTNGAARLVSRSELREALTQQPRMVVLRVIGPGMTDFLLNENGCQIRRTLAAGPEIVRVRVVAGHHEPLAWVERHRAALAAFERSLEGDAGIAANPEEILPVIRSIRFDPEPDQPANLYVEDYRFAHVSKRRVRHIRELFSDLLLIGADIEQNPPNPTVEAQS
ncbi:MAG: AAA family ATPase [Myxococcota bacterium]